MEGTSDMLNLLGMAQTGDALPFSISQTHPLYNKNKPVWDKMSDAYGGQEEIKAKGTKYLPMLSGQDATEYSNYKNRALWSDYTKYTIKNYLGMIYRKAPQIFYANDTPKGSQPPKEYFDAITDQGESLVEFTQGVAEEILKTNRVGVLVDFPKMSNVGNILELTKFDYEKMGIKPLMSMYDAFSIINWYWEYEDYKLIPKYFVLKETVYDGMQSGSIVSSESDIYRVLFLEPWEGSYRYKQIVFRERVVKRKTVSDVMEVITPMMNGEYISSIPFYVIDDKGINFKTIDKPMLNGLADINIGHYMNSADWENFLHMLGSPTMVFPGWDVKVYKNPRVGGALATPKGCEPKMVQASSDSSIRNEMDKKIEQMSVLGVQRLAGSSGYSASVDTARISNSSESSNLTIMVKSLSRSFTSILQFLLKWGRYDASSVYMSFNKDFFTDDIRSEDLLGWMKAYQQGGISWETYFNNLKKREVYEDGVDGDVEKERINESLKEQFDLSGERYLEILDTISGMKEDIQATITSSSSGQNLLSMSTASGGSNVSTSTEVSESGMESSGARNNETPGKSNASAKEDTDQTKVDEKKDPDADHTDNKDK